MNSKRLAMDGLLAGMCAALGAFSLDLGAFKFTLENFPVILGAFLFGPVDGLLIGGIGTFIYQVLKYGLEISTPLWIFPYMLSGLFVGFFAKKIHRKKRILKIVFLVVLNGILVTACNTIGLFIYYTYILRNTVETVIAALPTRLITGILKSVLYGFLIPPILKGVQKVKQKISENG